ncbi:MAG: hypothetical protein NTX88_11475 [Candidatus Atribacteria bacterium]|nr:hypothetical protein [Candidatus Atribacteria bacterium]
MMKRSLVLSVLLLVIFAASLAYADVTVTNTSGEKITFTDDEIGTIATSEKKPFEGVTVSVTVN